MSGCVWFFDGASGTRGGEDAAVAQATQVGDVTALLAVRVWHPPFSPADVVAEVAQLVKASGVTAITGDRWATGVIPEMFRAHHVTYHPCELDKSQLYLQLLPLINAGKVRLLDHPELLRQLRGLERRRGWGGRDKVDHRRGQRDDLANAVAGAVVLCAQGASVVPVRLRALGPEAWREGDREAEERGMRQRDHEDLVDRIRHGGGVYMPGIDG